MLFFYVLLKWKELETKGYIKTKRYDEGNRERNLFESKYTESAIQGMNDAFYMDYLRKGNFILHITRRTDSEMDVHVAVNMKSLDTQEYLDVIRENFPDCDIFWVKEETTEEYRRELTGDPYTNGRKILDKLGISYRTSFFDPLPFEYEEELQENVSLTKAKSKKRMDEILGSKSLREEIDRIFSRKNTKKYYGHPVHYLVSAGEWAAAEDIIDLLIKALIANGRLCSGRKAILRKIRMNAYKDERFLQIVKAAEGGSIIIELNGQDDMGMFASDFHEFTKAIGNMFGKQKKDTLFIFVELMGKSLQGSDAMSNITTKGDVIQIVEGTGTRQQAENYLRELVEKVDFITDDKGDVIDYLKDDESYTVTDIFNAYNAWFGSGLRNHVYKAYKTQTSYKVELTPAENKPYEELQQLIGLKEIKSVIDQIIAAGKVKCARESMGLNTDQSSLHMCLTGKPGSAKSTVARLLAKILKDENILKSGYFIECGRQDLVGKYVGWTAKIVEEKFKRAKGGILFIDEAYSLVDDSNTYGAEAINTITQLMENYRDQVIVIFAGYPDKMKTFLEQNEGLRSRIAFHLDFPDYSSDELVEILKLMAEKREYVIADDALPICRKYFEDASCVENFGNGRYVRNFLEQTIMRQSVRLQKEALAKADRQLTKEEMCLLTTEDLALLTQGEASRKVKMGFAS